MPVMAIRFKVVDDTGKVVCKISKETHFDKQMKPELTLRWTAQSKPMSKKDLERENPIPAQEGRLAKIRSRTIEGQKYLELPGLTLKWEKIEQFLEQLALGLGLADASGVVLKDDLEAATLTVDQLRRFA